MASPFASMFVSDPIPLPFDAGHWVKVRKLTGRQYEAAQDAHRYGTAAAPDKWAGFFRVVAAHGPTSEEVQRVLADPMTGFDRYELVRAGLAAWSDERPVPPYVNTIAHAKDVEADPSKADAIDGLPDDAVDFIAREVLKLAKPSLFLETEAQVEADQKNASGPSTTR